jgi:hypothetical protein
VTKKSGSNLIQLQERLSRYPEENWGYPFIAGFIILLSTAAVFLAVGLASTAEIAANCAYFALATGVVLQLIFFGRNKSKNGDVSNGPG